MSLTQTYERRTTVSQDPATAGETESAHKHTTDEWTPKKYSAERMMRAWVVRGFEWNNSSLNRPYKSIHITDGSIYWNQLCLATHREQYTVIHPNNIASSTDANLRRAINQQLTVLRKVLAECGYAETTGTSAEPSTDKLLEDAFPSAPDRSHHKPKPKSVEALEAEALTAESSPLDNLFG